MCPAEGGTDARLFFGFTRSRSRMESSFVVMSPLARERHGARTPRAVDSADDRIVLVAITAGSRRPVRSGGLRAQGHGRIQHRAQPCPAAFTGAHIGNR